MLWRNSKEIRNEYVSNYVSYKNLFMTGNYNSWFTHPTILPTSSRQTLLIAHCIRGYKFWIMRGSSNLYTIYKLVLEKCVLAALPVISHVLELELMKIYWEMSTYLRSLSVRWGFSVIFLVDNADICLTNTHNLSHGFPGHKFLGYRIIYLYICCKFCICTGHLLFWLCHAESSSNRYFRNQ